MFKNPEEDAIEIADTVKDIDDKERRNFNLCLLLGTAFGATIGGVATLVGTPPNAIAVGSLADAGLSVSFVKWMALAVPMMVVLLVM